MRALVKIRGFLFFIGMLFLNAFVDIGHKIVIQNTIFKVYEGATLVTLTAIINALILLPFVLLFTPAGFTSDRFAKVTVMRTCAWAAVGLTIAITLCYAQGWFWPAFAMTFLLAVQSAFFSPSKYGYIRELVSTDHLTQANGIVQAATTVAILSSLFAFSILFERELHGHIINSEASVLQTIVPIGFCLIAGALLEVFFAHRLPRTQAMHKTMQFNKTQYIRGEYLRANLRLTRKHETVILSIIGLAIFWAIAQVILAAFPAFLKETTGITDTVKVQGLLACSGFGIVAGSVVAGFLSRDHIETGLIPIGAFGVATALLFTPVIERPLFHGLNFVALGFLGGLFIIPLNALIQYHAEDQERGRILAGNNFIQNCVMLSFLALTVLFSVAGLKSKYLFYVLAVVGLGGALFTCYRLPHALVRLLVTFALKQRYRIDVVGFDRLPEKGGVLLLGNHISWIDWAIIQIACPRPIRFVMYRGIYERWYLRWFLDFVGVIPIGGAGSRDALNAVTEHLNAGEVVCLFPEGAISRSGHLGEFKHGFETASKGADAIIVPFYLRGLWGSRFSRANTHLQTMDRGYVRRDIIVAFGSPLPGETTAEQLKKRVFDLSVESWQRYTNTLKSVPESWLQTAKHKRTALVIADTMRGPLSSYRFITGVLIFSRIIKRLFPEQNVGLLLPTTNAGAIANMACLLRGKTVVNINYTASTDAVQAAIRKADLKGVLTSARFLERLKSRGSDPVALLAGITIHKMEELATEITKPRQVVSLLQSVLLPAFVLRWLYCRRVPLDSPAAIMFSSGSEGEPKGVVLSHRNFMANLKQIFDVLHTEADDVIMATLPQFHAFGLTVTTFMPLTEGIPVICHPDPTDVVNVAKAIATYRATILFGTSTFLRLYTKSTRVHSLMLQSIRIVVSGAEKLSHDVREAFKLKFNCEVYEGFGATETTPVASTNIPDHIDTDSWKFQIGNKPGTVGMPLPGTSFRIVDPKTLAELPTGTDGLILIGGAQVMLGYLDDPERTAEAIVEIDGTRWYKTGDKGHLDADGFLTIVDRYSRFAKIGGEMVSLTAVEERVRQILEEPECDLVAVNLPDGKKGEQIILLLTGDSFDPDEIRRTLIERDMHSLMLPSHIYLVDEVPKLGSGKTDFAKSRRLAVEIMSLETT